MKAYSGRFPCNVSVTMADADRLFSVCHVIGPVEAAKNAEYLGFSRQDAIALIRRNYIFKQRYK
jgi:hypothetical protein